MVNQKLIDEINKEIEERNLALKNQLFLQKILQLNSIIKLNTGVMLVGPTGSGKSTAMKVLFEAYCKVHGIKGDKYVLDPKTLTKEELYGFLDSSTLEWTDGVFTKILRKILDNKRGEA